MKHRHKHSIQAASAKAGMCSKTGSKYIQSGKLPSARQKKREYLTRPDYFAEHWPIITGLLEKSPTLQAKTMLTHLIEQYPDRYDDSKLRTLQKRLQVHRSQHGKNKSVIFCQNIKPGQSSQSDWTEMNSLAVTIGGKPFNHLIFHFMLPYSRWESIMICHVESFDTLSQGYSRATLELGGTLPIHRTDNLSAATKRAGGTRVFTERWQEFLAHHNVKPSRNNPGESHENGSIEKSHDVFKSAVNQHLLLRVSRDFPDEASYEKFLIGIKDQRNQMRKEALAEELPYLRDLPERNWRDPIAVYAKVGASSTINVLGCIYSVPSRLIGYTLQCEVFADRIDVRYGQQALFTMPRIKKGARIDYRHIIDSLVRKPGAFANYQYRDQLFPRPIFREAYDSLIERKPLDGHKDYLKLLHMAKCYGEQRMTDLLELRRKAHEIPDVESIVSLLQTSSKQASVIDVNIPSPNLEAYDQLHNFRGSVC
jgi:hypothetical protein